MFLESRKLYVIVTRECARYKILLHLYFGQFQMYIDKKKKKSKRLFKRRVNIFKIVFRMVQNLPSPRSNGRNISKKKKKNNQLREMIL